MIERDLHAEIYLEPGVEPCDSGGQLEVGCGRVAMRVHVLRVVEVQTRSEIVERVGYRKARYVLVEVAERIFYFAGGRDQVVARAADLAFPSDVALERDWTE